MGLSPFHLYACRASYSRRGKRRNVLPGKLRENVAGPWENVLEKNLNKYQTVVDAGRVSHPLNE